MKMLLAARLCADPLEDLKCSPRFLAAAKGEKTGKGKGEGEKGEGQGNGRGEGKEKRSGEKEL